MVQWLRFRASNAEEVGLTSDQGSKIPHAAWPKYINKILKILDFLHFH